MRVQKVLENMWQDYLVLNPEAQRVVMRYLLKGRALLTIILRSERLMSGWSLWMSVRSPLSMGYEEKKSYFLRLKSFVLNTMNTRRTQASLKSLSVNYWSTSSLLSFKIL